MISSSLYTQSFGNTQIAFASIIVIIAMGLSKFLKLDLEKDFFIASLRTTVQLIAVGYILRWILQADTYWVNFLVLLVMTLVAAQAVTSRLKQKSFKIFAAALLSLMGSTWPLGFLALYFFFHSEALRQTSFFIPFMGVVVGNALSSISLSFLGLQRLRAENILEVETFKALGANSLEACQRLYRDILRNALTPNLNGMTVVGIVSLPGVMAGQVIGGVDPLTAARFQILVMFLILLTAMVGSLIAMGLSHFFFMPPWFTDENSNWSFKIPPGAKWALMGPSGTGKSRLLKSMTGIDLSSIRDDVKKSSNVSFEKTARRVCYVHQKSHFIPGTVEDNLLYPYQFKAHRSDRYNREFVLNLLNQLGLSEETLRKNAMTLSGGEGQLIHLIRALQFHPRGLFLDEPTSSLDSQRTALFEQLLDMWLAQGDHNLIFITHNKEQAVRFASQVLHLENGSLRYV
ncbi:MAG TPA: ABC transporter permease [Bdellovibrio sp.]|uniref:ABC transporter permease n=1 Tax=Bdellovibrio sp. TaxID=28201 RepID=UPI002F1336C9